MYLNHHYRVHWFISKNIFFVKKKTHIYLCQKIQIARYKRVVNKLINYIWLVITALRSWIGSHFKTSQTETLTANSLSTSTNTPYSMNVHNSFHIVFLMSSAEPGVVKALKSTSVSRQVPQKPPLITHYTYSSSTHFSLTFILHSTYFGFCQPKFRSLSIHMKEISPFILLVSLIINNRFTQKYAQSCSINIYITTPHMPPST